MEDYEAFSIVDAMVDKIMYENPNMSLEQLRTSLKQIVDNENQW